MGRFVIDELVGACLEAVRSEGSAGALAVSEVLDRVLTDGADIEAAAGTASEIEPFTVWHQSPELTVLHVVWPPGVDLLAHDHRMWAVIGVYGGREDNRFFRRLPDDRLEGRSGRTIATGDTLAMGDDTIHAVANPSQEWTAAIHCYGGDFFAVERRMWPDPAARSVDFDVAQVTATLNEAAARARAPHRDTSSRQGPEH